MAHGPGDPGGAERATSLPHDPDSPPDRGRREHRKHATRRVLLAAGRRLFGEQGLYDSRIEDLTRHAGIAKGTLYGYFENKEQLLEAVVTAGFEELLAHVRHAAAGVPAGAPRIERVVSAHLVFFAANPDLVRIFHQVRGLLKFDRPEGLPLRRALEQYLGDVARVLEPANGRRTTVRRESVEAASLLFGAVSGVSSMRAALPTAGARRRPPRAVVRALAALVPASAAEESGGRGAAAAATRAGRRRPAPASAAGGRAAR